MELFDLFGKKVLTGILSADKVNRIDVSTLPSGVYLFKFSNEQNSVLKKIVVSH